jgi:hypothetical protein
MSNNEDRVKHSKRLHQEQTVIKKQSDIAKSHGLPVTEPHMFAKHHATDCGNPDCPTCGNPRHNGASKDRLTVQEKRLFQDVDTPHHGLHDE